MFEALAASSGPCPELIVDKTAVRTAQHTVERGLGPRSLPRLHPDPKHVRLPHHLLPDSHALQPQSREFPGSILHRGNGEPLVMSPEPKVTSLFTNPKKSVLRLARQSRQYARWRHMGHKKACDTLRFSVSRHTFRCNHIANYKNQPMDLLCRN